VVSFTLRPLYSRGKSPVPIGEETGWAPEPVWKMWRREKPLALVWNQTPAVQPVTIPTELSWLTTDVYSQMKYE
jgi:hypothetical protein